MPGSFALPPRRDADDRILCSECDLPAVAQWNVDCDDCTDVATSASVEHDAALAERDLHVSVMDAVVQAVAGRVATDEESARYLIARDAARRAGSQLAGLSTSVLNHSVPHVHPVFGCATHGEA